MFIEGGLLPDHLFSLSKKVKITGFWNCASSEEIFINIFL
jgi:hypothetical protein